MDKVSEIIGNISKLSNDEVKELMEALTSTKENNDMPKRYGWIKMLGAYFVKDNLTESMVGKDSPNYMMTTEESEILEHINKLNEGLDNLNGKIFVHSNIFEVSWNNTRKDFEKYIEKILESGAIDIEDISFSNLFTILFVAYANEVALTDKMKKEVNNLRNF